VGLQQPRLLSREVRSIWFERNLIEALEVRKVGSNPQTILERLQELERENNENEGKLTVLKAERSVDSRCNETSHLVANFILNFEEEFERSDPYRKKALLKQCISDILVDRERKVVRFSVRRIPVMTAEIESLLKEHQKLGQILCLSATYT
jgi:hypothetical protein